MRLNIFIKSCVIFAISSQITTVAFASNVDIEGNYTIKRDNPYTTGIIGREQHGGGYWTSSNLREWMNSDSSKVGYTNNPPSPQFMGNDAYDSESGFLNQFTASEKNAIAVTERRIFVHKDTDPEAVEGGSGGTGHANVYGPGFLTNYDWFAFSYKNYSHKKDNDKVFLLTPFETYWYLNRRDFSYSKQLTEAAKKKNNTSAAMAEWWLQGNTRYKDYDFMYYARADKLVGNAAANGKRGVVPAINIKPSYIFNTGRRASDLKIGEDVIFGTYLNEPISWKVINISDTGYHLLLSNNILDLKRYDAPGDQSKKYSDFINFSNPDISLFNDVQYKSTTLSSDKMPPKIEVLNPNELEVRQNGSYTLQFRASDDSSGLDYIILPNGRKITDSHFEYTFSSNGNTLIKAMDKAGNFLEFMVPISNVNKEPEVLVTPSTTNWTNTDVDVDIKASNDVRYKGGFQLTNLSEWGGPIFPNYTSYVGKKFRVTGKVKLISYTEQAKSLGLGIGYSLRARGKSEYTYKLSGSWTTARTIRFNDFKDNNWEVPLDFEFEVPGTYSEGLSPWIVTGLSPLIGEVARFEFVDLEYKLIDDSDFKITGIRLPNGNKVTGVSTYKDTLSKEGTHNSTYVVEDNRGKETSRTITTKIDKTKPTGSVIGVSTTPTNKDVTLTINGGDTLSGIKEIVTPNGVVNLGNKLSVSTQYIASVNGNITFTIRDLAGNEQIVNANVDNIDKVKPIVAVKGTSDIWTMLNAMVSATATDNKSGINKIEYFLSGATNKGWGTFSSEVNITSEGTTNVEFRAVDNAGNISDIVRGNVKLDKTPATGKFSTLETSNSRDIVISGKSISDIHSGTFRALVSNSGDYSNATEVIIGNSVSKDFNFKLDKKATQFDNYGNRKIYIKLIDYAGNVSEYIVSTILIPSGQPKVTLDYPINNTLYAKNETIKAIWKLQASDPDFPNIQQVKSVFRVENIATGEQKEYAQVGSRTDYMLSNLPVGKYNVQVDSYITDTYKTTSEKHILRIDKYLSDGIVNSKTIDVGSPIKYINVKTSSSVPKGTRILGRIYYKTPTTDFNKTNYVDLNSEVGLKDDVLITLPIKASAIKIQYNIYNDKFASNDELTPYLDSVVISAR